MPKHDKPNLSRENPWYYLRPAFYGHLSEEEKTKAVDWESARDSDEADYNRAEADKKANAIKSREVANEKRKKARAEGNLAKHGSEVSWVWGGGGGGGDAHVHFFC